MPLLEIATQPLDISALTPIPPAPAPIRRDIGRLTATAELFFGIEIPASDHEFLGDLLDKWSARAILAGIEILAGTEPDRDLLPLVREKITRVLGYIAEGGPLDETTADAWRIYSSSGRLPDASTLTKLGEINRGNYTQFSSGAVNLKKGPHLKVPS